jgi:photosystem II stability/assembly factor-like uncharacterized protein
MNRFNFTLVILLSLIANLRGQWEILNEGVKGSLNAIDFINENVGWIGGSEGLLFKTQDGGQIWYPILLDKNWSINKIDFVNDSVGWAIGNTDNSAIEMIIKTTDGGENWLLQKKIYNCHMHSLFAVNDSVVYVAGERLIYKTEDGGSSWVYIAPKNEATYFSIYFLNSDTGIVAGSYCDTQCYSIIWKTYDGGRSWHELTLPSVNSFQDLQFIDTMTGYFVSRDYENYQSFLYETKDFGDSWRVKSNIANSVISLTFINSQTAFAVMSDSTSHHNILKSTDGGMTWDESFAGFLFGSYNIYFRDEQVGVVFGAYVGGGILLSTFDQGDHWKIHKLSCSFNDLFFFNKDQGLLIGGFWEMHTGSMGYVFSFNDGGKSLHLNYEDSGEPILGFSVNETMGFILCQWMSMRGLSSFTLAKTLDSGQNWQFLPVGEEGNCHDMYFANESVGWLVGSFGHAKILKTTDGGEKWQPEWQHADTLAALHSIYFVNQNSGWAVGDQGMIVKYMDQNEWTLAQAVTDLPLRRVFFVNENNGWIAGDNLNDFYFLSILLKTQDGGETWEKIPVNYCLQDIYFQDTQHGWAIGSNRAFSGAILQTTDGGDHWAVQKDSLIGPLYSLSYRDNFLWAVGDYGLVLRIDLTTAVDDYQNQHLPSAFELLQNYPNPFNASTAISYQLSAVSQVELSIYNLLGQKMATLVSAKQSAGSYKVEWDGAEFPSSVYFCCLEAGGFVKAIKLALVK